MDAYSALAEPTRRQIIEMLSQRGTLSATAIYEKFTVSHPAISQHLKILRESNLVLVEKKAQQRLYHINPSSIQEIDMWIQKVQKNWNERYNRLDALLKEEKRKLKKGGEVK